MSSDVAIVTAVAGAYDHSRRKETRVSGADHFFFTDPESADICGDWWARVPLGGEGSPRLRAKGPKLNPHGYDFLLDYEYVIWVDGGITVLTEHFADEILGHMENGMILSPHYDGRDDAYGEATIRSPKYENEPLDEQCAFYRELGFPENYGLYECGVLARRMDVSAVKNLGEMWLGEVNKWSIQDQVSLPFCLWQLGYQPDVLPKSFRKFGWVSVNAHKSEL